MNGIDAFSEPTSIGSRPVVVPRELRAELPHPRAELGGREEHLADAGVMDARFGQDAFWSPKRAASRSKSRS